MLSELTLEDFAVCLDETFRIDLGDGDMLPVVLVEARPLGSGPVGAREPFSLLFRGPAAPVLAQQIRHLVHPRMGDFDIFLVPIGPDRGGAMRYEAIFT